MTEKVMGIIGESNSSSFLALGDHDKHTETIVGTGAVIAYL